MKLFFVTLAVFTSTVCYGSEPIIIPVRNNLVVHATSPDTLLIMGNFVDSQLACVSTVETKWQQSCALYEEITWGDIDLPYDIVGPWDIAYSKDTPTCDPGAIMDQLNAQALAHGVDISPYGHLVYVVPWAMGCGLGLSTLGGNPSLSWLFACPNSDVYAHEFGHALGMHHASTPTASYGDTSDIMGYSLSRLYQVNSSHRDQMSWTSSIRTVTQSGTYTIAPLENDGAMLIIGPLASGKHLFISYRQPIGYDSNLDSKYFTIAVHEYTRYRAERTFLLALLGEGQSYSNGGITITGGVRDISGATVFIGLQGPVPAPPTNLRIEP